MHFHAVAVFLTCFAVALSLPADSRCPAGEIYKECGTACPKTCDNHNKEQICFDVCVSGCFCPEGLVRNKNNVCVPVLQCSNERCPAGEIYQECGTACPRTCDNHDKEEACLAVCVSGCFCPEGTVRNKNNVCVAVTECANDRCPAGEIYQECGTACPKTCDNHDKIKGCLTVCKTGCFCPEGLVRNKDNVCVRVTECSNDRCPAGEIYQECGTACPKTCDNHDKVQPCIAMCKSGCFCPEGLVRNKDNVCVPVLECSNDRCPAGEIYKECGTACPKTCDNHDKIRGCPDVCKTGCFCPEGLVRNAKNVCVKVSECSNDRCPAGEIYKQCGTKCPKTCDNHDKNIACVKMCQSGCFCAEGSVRNKNNVCVPVSECPNDRCPAGEIYNKCGTMCPRTCANHDKNIPCVKMCKAGCFCPEGSVRNANNVCVAVNECSNDRCPAGEIYNECGTMCPKTCANHDKEIPCVKMCKSGCFCPEGSVRNANNVCVAVNECSNDRCPAGEIYKECGTACPKTCANRKRGTLMCPSVCISGCFCPDGLVRNKNNVCVKESECPNDQCPAGEVYNECGTACPKTCDNYNKAIPCVKSCETGCFCPGGQVRNKDNVCVPVTSCPNFSCGENEVKSQCVVPCNNCRHRGHCNFLVCNPGCDCEEGFHRDRSGKCIPAISCP